MNIRGIIKLILLNLISDAVFCFTVTCTIAHKSLHICTPIEFCVCHLSKKLNTHFINVIIKEIKKLKH